MPSVNNHDVVGLYNRLNRFIVELVKAVSANTSDTKQADITRLETYLAAITTYKDWVTGQPQLDLPETAPRSYELEAPPEVPDLENESTNDMVRLLVITRDELVNSQSARDPAGLNKFDKARTEAIVAKAKAFLDTYIKVATPLDLPESSPQALSGGPGLGGVNPS